MAVITKSLDVGAIASATSVSVRQKNQQTAATLRPEKIVCIGQASSDKTVTTNELVLGTGNADDVGVQFGFGSPLHRMARKLYPKAGNGSKVDTYFMAVPAVGSAAAEVKTITVALGGSGILKSFNGYVLMRDMVFEAAADVAGKVATNAHNNPAKSPRGTDLNAYETTKYPFTITKDMTDAQAAAALKEALEDYLELPFTMSISSAVITLTAKWLGADSAFDLSIVDEKGDTLTTATHGISMTIAETTASAGVGVIPSAALAQMDDELGVTRVVSQYSNSTVLDVLQEKFEAFHDGLIAQYVLCYSAIKAPESSGKVDVATLIAGGNARRDDSINVQIFGDYGDLEKLEYFQRNQLLKAGYSNLVHKNDGSYRLMDLVTFYHPQGKQNPLFRFDRDVTCIANVCYDFMNTFRDSDEWKSVILISEKDITTNPAARSLKDIKAAVNKRIGLLGMAGIIANYQEAQKETQVEIDSSNPNRVNINPYMDISGVGRIFDLTNFIGFYFGG